LVLLGAFQVLSWGINVSERIYGKLDRYKGYEQREEKHEDLAKRAYSNGRLWGDVTAEGYEAGGVDDILYEKMSVEEYSKLAGMLLDERKLDFYCWGADDCGDLPTTEQLNEWFGADWGSKNMPVNAFRSGFIDAFVEYLD
jgi:hypothetical protein